MIADPRTDILTAIHQTLKRVYGFGSFRPQQQEIIEDSADLRVETGAQ